MINKTIETVKLDLGGSRSPNCGLIPSKYIDPNQHNNSFNESGSESQNKDKAFIGLTKKKTQPLDKGVGPVKTI